MYRIRKCAGGVSRTIWHGQNLFDPTVRLQDPKSDSLDDRMMKESESKLLERSFEPCYQATVGMDFVSKLVTLEVRENQQVAVSEVVLKELLQAGQQIRLQLWDTAGQERFRSLVPSLKPRQISSNINAPVRERVFWIQS